MSMFQLILKFGESVKLEDFAVDYLRFQPHN